jgi:hypothetical protein
MDTMEQCVYKKTNYNEYIFPIAEIENHIISFLDPKTIYQGLMRVNKFYYQQFKNDNTYQDFKHFYNLNVKNMSNQMRFKLACIMKNLTVVLYYIRNLPIIDNIDNNCILRGFEYACINGCLEISKNLYDIIRERKILPSIIHRSIAFSLMNATREGCLEVVKWLYNIVINDNFFDSNIYNHLFQCKNILVTREKLPELLFLYACKYGGLEIICWLYSTKNAKKLPFDIHINDEQAFINACASGYIEIAKWLYNCGISENNMVNIHSQNDHAFLYACIFNHLEIAKWLYQKSREIGSLFDITNIHFFKSLFRTVCEEKAHDVALWLCCLEEFKMSPNFNRNIEFAFQYVCSAGYLTLAKKLYQLYPNFITIGAKRSWAFRWACRNSHLEIAKWLYYLDSTNKTINIHAKNEWAFRWACRNGHFKVAKWLYYLDGTNKTINIHAKNEWAFRWACRNGHFKVIKWLHLIEKNTSSIDIFAKKGWAISWLYTNNHNQIIKWLFEHYTNFQAIRTIKLLSISISFNIICYLCDNFYQMPSVGSIITLLALFFIIKI